MGKTRLSSNMTRVDGDIPFVRPPRWAVLERRLIDLMNEAVDPLMDKYVHPDGAIMWPTTEDFVSADGLDDAYESFHNWPTFYMLGGADRIMELATRQWNAITRQFAKYDCGVGHPMVVKEYEQGYDWMHQGEGYVYFYQLCMADPSSEANHDRAERFAGFYMNEDPEADNFDPQRKLLKGPWLGSMGPGYAAFEKYLAVYKPYSLWRKYPLPYLDVPGCNSAEDIKDLKIARRMGQVMVDRMSRGDCATNLAVTSLIANAFMFSADEKYKTWIRDYVEVWMQRAKANGGIMPDNVGLSGKVGEYMGGKWYGSYYGWTWPHGWHLLADAVLSAAENAALLFQDTAYLDFARSQVDVLMREGVVKDGTLHVPHYHTDDGWEHFSPMSARVMAHIWTLSMRDDDLERLIRLRNHESKEYEHVLSKGGKDQALHEAPWIAFINGEYPQYPEHILEHNLAQAYKRLAFMVHDKQDPKTYGDWYLQARNPVTTEGLVQLTMGGPVFLYNGGLLMVRFRYFDLQRKRPGLPQGVAALVATVEDRRAVVHLVNLDPTEKREVVVQGGAFGEHEIEQVRYQRLKKDLENNAFVDAKWTDEGFYSQAMNERVTDQVVQINDKWFLVRLSAHSQVTLDVSMKRMVREPSYQVPWND